MDTQNLINMIDGTVDKTGLAVQTVCNQATGIPKLREILVRRLDIQGNQAKKLAAFTVERLANK